MSVFVNREEKQVSWFKPTFDIYKANLHSTFKQMNNLYTKVVGKGTGTNISPTEMDIYIN